MTTEPLLTAATTDVEHQRDTQVSNFSRMYAGSPATYSDIQSGYTFERSKAANTAQLIAEGKVSKAIVLGVSGVGKTTFARQVCSELSERGLAVWEHKTDRAFHSDEWRNVAKRLVKNGSQGVLFIDDADAELFQINKLVDLLAADSNVGSGLNWPNI